MAVGLLSLRVGATLLMTPVLAASSVPPTVRVLLVIAIACMCSGLSQSVLSHDVANSLIDHPGLLIQAAATELTLGATLGLGILLAFGAFSIAGGLLDIQIGFGIAQVFDPITNTQSSILTSAFNQIALVAFFLVDAHHALLRGFAYSLERFPLGGEWPINVAFAPLAKQVAGLFSLGFALAAPVVFCILLIDLMLGVVARNLPQINMLVLGVPVKITAGLIALSLWFGGMGNTMSTTYASIFRTWDAIFSAAAMHGTAARGA